MSVLRQVAPLTFLIMVGCGHKDDNPLPKVGEQYRYKGMFLAMNDPQPPKPIAPKIEFLTPRPNATLRPHQEIDCEFQMTLIPGSRLPSRFIVEFVQGELACGQFSEVYVRGVDGDVYRLGAKIETFRSGDYELRVQMIDNEFRERPRPQPADWRDTTFYSSSIPIRVKGP